METRLAEHDVDHVSSPAPTALLPAMPTMPSMLKSLGADDG